jgi:hypothetical protein
MPELITDLEISLETITTWLRGSGLTVNESKTELYLFLWYDQPRVTIRLFTSSKYTMKVLGVTFDSKLQWSAQVSNAILKANRSLCAIKLIKGFFTKDELCTLLTTNFYSILFYNSEIWHIPSPNPNSKQHMLVASAKALQLCNKDHSVVYLCMDLHRINK